MKLVSKILSKKENEIGSVEKKLATLMDRKKDVGEFSVDLYYNDGCGKETCYVAKLTMYSTKDGGKNHVYHARCANFCDAIDAIEKHIGEMPK